MKNTCKNKDCGCQKGLTTECSPLPVCPNPQPCSYVTDAKCVVYSGDTVLCGSQVYLPSGTKLDVALKDIYEKLCKLLICNLSAVIFVNDPDPDDYKLSVTVAGGSGSYTYNWSFIDSFGSVGFTTGQNSVIVGINTEISNARLVQVIVTDTATNCKVKQTFLVVIPED